MNFFAKLQKIDRRVLYLILASTVAFALIRPMGLPIKINKETQQTYDFIDALPEGSTVVVLLDYGADAMPELHTNALAVGKHLFSKHMKVIGVTMWQTGTGMLNLFFDTMKKEFPELQYGVDYVNLGYKPGGQVWAEKATVDFAAACAGVDVTGQPMSSFPITQNVKTSMDTALWIDFAAGNPGIEELVKTVGAKGTPIIGAVTAVSITSQLPLLQTGQIKGLQMGMRGAAEYEKLVDRPGNATSGMDAQSLTHVLLVLFILLGNIGYLASKQSGAKR